MLKPGIYNRVERPDCRITIVVSKHAAERLVDPTRFIREHKIRRMLDEAIDESVDTLYGHAETSTEPMHMVVRSKSGYEVLVLALSIRRNAAKLPNGSFTDAVNVTVQTMHGKDGFGSRMNDYEMEVNGRRVELLFEPSVARELRRAVAVVVREVYAEEGMLDDNAGYHLGSELVDFWVTPVGGRLEIETPRWRRETYELDVA